MGKFGGYLYGATNRNKSTDIGYFLAHDFCLVVDAFDAHEHLLQ